LLGRFVALFRSSLDQSYVGVSRVLVPFTQTPVLLFRATSLTLSDVFQRLQPAISFSLHVIIERRIFNRDQESPE